MDLEWIKQAITEGKFKLLRTKFLNNDTVLRQVVNGDPKIFHDLILHAFDRLLFESLHRRKKYNKIISRFIKAAKPVHFGLIGGTTLLIRAVIAHTSYENIRLLIEAGSDVNATESEYSVLVYSLMWCYDIDVVKELIKNGADVNYRGPHGRTPLFILLGEPADPKVIPILVESGADILHCDDSGMNILMDINCSCIYGTPCKAKEAVDLFIKKGGNIRDKDHAGNTMLHHTCCKYLFDLASRSGVSIEAKNNSGHTALMAAVIYYYTSKVRYLLQLGADPNCTDLQLNTILHLFVLRIFSHDETVDLILYHGGDWNARNLYNQTPLDILLKNI